MTPMNHREMEYNSSKLWEMYGMTLADTKYMFSEWKDEQQREKAIKLMDWLAETQEKVCQQDLLLDYGSDCLRLYLMFEKEPKPEDVYLDTWEECNLEGCYKFLGKYRRTILTAIQANKQGKYSDTDVRKIATLLESMKQDCMKFLSKNNTMPNRHNAISVIMEGMKTIQKELHIGELVSSMHSHEIEMAVPHSNLSMDTFSDGAEKHGLIRKEIVQVCKECILLMAPFAPHLSEELWQSIQENQKESCVLQQKWIKTDDNTFEKELVIPVQVNAKTRRILRVTSDTEEAAIRKMAEELVASYIRDGDYRCIYIREKIINFVKM